MIREALTSSQEVASICVTVVAVMLGALLGTIASQLIRNKIRKGNN